MRITKYNLGVCRNCYRLMGNIEEEKNGIVPVFCMCDVSAGRTSASNPRIQGGVIPDGTVLLRFMPCSDYRRDDGDFRHVPHFAGFGWGNGHAEHLAKLMEFIQEKNNFTIFGANKDYTHFITFDQMNTEMKAGLTNLYYRTDINKIRILREFDNDFNSYETYFSTQLGDKECLKRFFRRYLINYAGATGNPVWVASNILSKDEFTDIKKHANKIITKIRKRG